MTRNQVKDQVLAELGMIHVSFYEDHPYIDRWELEEVAERIMHTLDFGYTWEIKKKNNDKE